MPKLAVQTSCSRVSAQLELPTVLRTAVKLDNKVQRAQTAWLGGRIHSGLLSRPATLVTPFFAIDCCVLLVRYLRRRHG